MAKLGGWLLTHFGRSLVRFHPSDGQLHGLPRLPPYGSVMLSTFYLFKDIFHYIAGFLVVMAWLPFWVA